MSSIILTAEQIKVVQEALIANGFTAGGTLIADGEFGRPTVAALAIIQDNNGIPPTGEFTLATLLVLNIDFNLDLPIKSTDDLDSSADAKEKYDPTEGCYDPQD